MGTCRALVLLLLLSTHAAATEIYSLLLELSWFLPIPADRPASRFGPRVVVPVPNCPGRTAKRGYRVY